MISTALGATSADTMLYLDSFTASLVSSWFKYIHCREGKEVVLIQRQFSYV